MPIRKYLAPDGTTHVMDWQGPYDPTPADMARHFAAETAGVPPKPTLPAAGGSQVPRRVEGAKTPLADPRTMNANVLADAGVAAPSAFENAQVWGATPMPGMAGIHNALLAADEKWKASADAGNYTTGPDRAHLAAQPNRADALVRKALSPGGIDVPGAIIHMLADATTPAGAAALVGPEVAVGAFKGLRGIGRALGRSEGPMLQPFKPNVSAYGQGAAASDASVALPQFFEPPAAGVADPYMPNRSGYVPDSASSASEALPSTASAHPPVEVDPYMRNSGGLPSTATASSTRGVPYGAAPAESSGRVQKVMQAEQRQAEAELKRQIAVRKAEEAKQGLVAQQPTVSEGYSTTDPKTGQRTSVSQRWSPADEEQAAAAATPPTPQAPIDPLDIMSGGQPPAAAAVKPTVAKAGARPPAGTPAGDIYDGWVAKGRTHKQALELAAEGKAPLATSTAEATPTGKAATRPLETPAPTQADPTPHQPATLTAVPTTSAKTADAAGSTAGTDSLDFLQQAMSGAEEPPTVANGGDAPFKVIEGGVPRQVTPEEWQARHGFMARNPGVEAEIRGGVPAGSTASASVDPRIAALQAEVDALPRGEVAATRPAEAAAADVPSARDVMAQQLIDAMDARRAAAPGKGMFTNNMAPSTIRDSLVDNPRFRSLDPAERARRYRELGGLDAEMKKLPPSADESGAVDPAMLLQMSKMGLGAATGGTIGASRNPDHPWAGGITGALLGAAGGGLIPTPAVGSLAATGGKAFAKGVLDPIRYEGALAGAPQVSNLLGNVGSLAFTPIVKALQGDTAGARQLASLYADPGRVGRIGIDGFKSGWRDSVTQSNRFGRTMEPWQVMGRTLHSVDAGTKAILKEGGVTAADAATMTYSGDPVTKAGKGLAMLQSTLPGRLITPFARTALNIGELGAAMTPLRALSPELRALLPVKEGMSPLRAGLHEAALMTPGVAAGAMGLAGLGPSSSTATSLLGPFSGPYAIGRGVRDYAQYGHDDAGSAVQAGLNQVPFLGDIPKLTQNPGKMAAGVAAMPIPQFLQMFGDHTVRQPNGIMESLQERIPGLRDSLPAKVDFFGEPLQRNVIGGQPAPIYERDPLASKLADFGVLKRQPSPTLGGVSPQSALEKAGIAAYLDNLPASDRARVSSILNAATPMGNDELTGHETSQLQADRGRATKAILGQVIGSPEFSTLPLPAQKALVRLWMGIASGVGTQQFKAERIGAAVAPDAAGGAGSAQR